jgi:hypothetical protein
MWLCTALFNRPDTHAEIDQNTDGKAGLDEGRTIRTNDCRIITAGGEDVNCVTKRLSPREPLKELILGGDDEEPVIRHSCPSVADSAGHCLHRIEDRGE